MYDPALGRFVSADSVVPGSASGSMNGVALKPLTVDFHEPGFVATLNAENQQRFWFQMSDEERQKAGSPWGPANPQALNRYSYVLNNPLKYVDLTGHTWYLSKTQAKELATGLRRAVTEIIGGAALGRTAQEIITKLWKASGLIEGALSGNFFRAIATGLAEACVAGVAAGLLLGGALAGYLAYEMTRMANFIDDYTGDAGIGIATDGNGVFFLNRSSGDAIYWDPGLSIMGHFLVAHLPTSMSLESKPVSDEAWWTGWHFTDDERWVQPTHLPVVSK
jgi:hypothetical protein